MSDKSSNIGLVGCGAIGTEIAGAIASGEVHATLGGVWDVSREAAEALAANITPCPPVLSPEQMVESCGMIVECAAVDAVAPLADLCVNSGVSLMVMSIGALNKKIFEKFNNSSSRLYVPSGAVCGLDGIQAYAGHNILSLALTTRKPPKGLKGVKYISEKNIDLDSITEPVTVFEGSPAEAIKHFPKNINVATALALASETGGELTVRIIADPAATTNIHEVSLVCDLGKIDIRVENLPSASNPKTSALAYLSAIASLKKIYSRVIIGT